jgi:aminopeptidase N
MVDRPSWADVVRVGAMDGLAALRDETGLETVLERTRYGYPSRGRRAALAALAQLGEGKKVREHLETLLEDADPHLRIEVVNALVTLGDARAKRALRRALDHELDGRVTRRIRESLRDWPEGPNERKRLNDELESVRSEFVELKARLAKLEAKNASSKPIKKAGVPKKAAKRRRKR